MKVCIGTKNPAKIAAVEKGFSSYQNISTIALNVKSGVSDQPFSDEETISGAVNRAKAALKEEADGEIGIGLEGGVDRIGDKLFICNWGALVLEDGTTYIAGGARFPLPSEIKEELEAGEELGPIMDRYSNRNNVRHHEGAIGIFTNGKINRSEMFLHVMQLLIGQYEYDKKFEV